MMVSSAKFQFCSRKTGIAYFEHLALFQSRCIRGIHQVGVSAFRDCLHTMGSISLTPLSSAGLWLAVTITPIHCPLSFLERRPASRPTAKTTVLRRSLRHVFGQQASTSTNGRSRGAFVWRRGRSVLKKLTPSCGTVGAKQSWLASDHKEDAACRATYTCGAILEDLALRLRVMQSRLGDRFLDSRGGHCCATSCNQGESRKRRWGIKATGDECSQRNFGGEKREEGALKQKWNEGLG